MTVAAPERTAELARRVDALFEPTTSRAGKPGGAPGFLGIELELLPVRREAALPGTVRPGEVVSALQSDAGLLDEARISFEPGGQLELSPPPQPSARDLLDTLAILMARLRRCGDEAGITFVSAATSPWHDVETIGLQNSHPRYLEMQRHFDRIGSAGRQMMRQTTALQLCLDGEAGVQRWQLLNQAGPAIAASFAASPVVAGRESGAASSRLAIWQEVDATRTGFDGEQAGSDLEGAREAYASFALQAEAIPLPRTTSHAPLERVPLRAWLDAGEERPDGADLDHHLTTLFPPVRPRGYLEVRYLDNLPARWVPVAVCLLAALTVDADTQSEALEQVGEDVRPSSETWRETALHALRDSSLQVTARELFRVAEAAAARAPDGYLPGDAGRILASFREEFIEAGRCPADELLAQWRSRPEEVSIWI